MREIDVRYDRRSFSARLGGGPSSAEARRSVAPGVSPGEIERLLSGFDDASGADVKVTGEPIAGPSRASAPFVARRNAA